MQAPEGLHFLSTLRCYLFLHRKNKSENQVSNCNSTTKKQRCNHCYNANNLCIKIKLLGKTCANTCDNSIA